MSRDAVDSATERPSLDGNQTAVRDSGTGQACAFRSPSPSPPRRARCARLRRRRPGRPRRHEIVYRSDPGEKDFFFAEAVEGTLHFRGPYARVTAGPGCSGELVTCSLDGITAIRVLAADGDDNVSVSGVVPVVADLGAGADEFIVGSEAGYPATLMLALGEGDDSAEVLAANVTVDAGHGNDRIDASVDQTLETTGPARVEGGDGDDTVYLDGRTPGIVLSGGAGDDSLTVMGGTGHAPVDVACGPGDDRTFLTPRDPPGTVARRTSPGSRPPPSLAPSASAADRARVGVRDVAPPRPRSGPPARDHRAGNVHDQGGSAQSQPAPDADRPALAAPRSAPAGVRHRAHACRERTRRGPVPVAPVSATRHFVSPPADLLAAYRTLTRFSCGVVKARCATSPGSHPHGGVCGRRRLG